MAKKRARQKVSPASQGSERGASASWVVLLPALVGVLLSIPCLRLGYFWDDYHFLDQRAGGDVPGFLLPDPGSTFYRPIAQGVYFLLLRFADPSGGFLGHVCNLAALAGAITLLVLLVSRLAGLRAGLFSGLVFASFGAVPSLVAWISCSQDLFAIAFVLAAFLFRHEQRDVAALACATAAVLCKEPAIAAFPVLVLWDRLIGRPAARPWIRFAGYAGVLLLWVIVHPGIRLLLGRGFRSGATGYVGLESSQGWSVHLGRYVATLFNLPPSGYTTAPLDDRLAYGVVALVTMIVGVWYFERLRRRERPEGHARLQRIAWIAGLFGIPTLLLPTLLVRHWAPYFACIPAAAFAMLLGPILARQRVVIAVAVLGAFLSLGVRYRIAHPVGEAAWTESVFVEAAGAVKVVRANFRALFPAFPRDSQIVISTSSTGVRGIHGTLVDNQALRAWYRDPSLRTVTTLKRRPGAPAEFLVRITADLDVLAIDPDTHDVRSATPTPPDLSEIDRPLRNYARAVAAGGEFDRAIRILESLSRAGPMESRVSAERLIVAILLATARRGEAERILEASRGITRNEALAQVERLMVEATESERLDEASFEAFGLSGTDPETIRRMMRDFRRDGLATQAEQFAKRLLRLVPGDPEAAGVLR